MAHFETALHMRPDTQICAAQVAMQVAVAEMLALPAAELTRGIENELARNPALNARSQASFDPGAVERMAPAESPRDSLLADVAGDLPAADRWIAEMILHDLDSRGRLGRDAASAALWLRVDVSRVERVLRALRAAATPDLAAADLREALLLQLDALPTGSVPAVLRDIVRDHLPDVAEDRLADVARSLHTSEDDIRGALAILSHKCSPGFFDTSRGPAPAPPDIVVTHLECGRLDVTVPQIGPTLEVDPMYARLAAVPDGLTDAEAALARAQVAEAREFMTRLSRRTGALQRIAATAVAEQTGFVLGGPARHRPMTRVDLARLVAMHPSTVSRAVSGKTVRMPDRRLVPFADFFGGATSALELLAQAIAAEDSPQSDSALAHHLAQHGIRLARRTVAKYRAQLRLPAVSQR